MKTIKIIFYSIPSLLLMMVGCNTGESKIAEPNNDLVNLSTYEVIQTEIWDQSCISCHMTGASYANQSGLILTADVSYEQLMNRVPNNVAAAEDGLLLVGDEGYASLPKSFLWEKINANDMDHFYQDHPEYGAIMPLGDDFLTNGELEFMRQWIEAGAPETALLRT